MEKRNRVKVKTKENRFTGEKKKGEDLCVKDYTPSFSLDKVHRVVHREMSRTGDVHGFRTVPGIKVIILRQLTTNIYICYSTVQVKCLG